MGDMISGKMQTKHGLEPVPARLRHTEAKAMGRSHAAAKVNPQHLGCSEPRTVGKREATQACLLPSAWKLGRGKALQGSPKVNPDF